MGVWNSNKTVITDAGISLLAGITGKVALKLSRAVAGSDYTEPEELSKMTSISHIQMDMGFSEVGEGDAGTAFVDLYLENSSITESFYHQQIGIYAKDEEGTDVLFLVAQADVPDHIPDSSSPIYVTHRIFLKFSGNADVSLNVDFSGVVTQNTLREALKKKEPAFDKNSAFNRNFSDSASDYMPLGKKANAGGANSVARSDHIHPVGTILKYAENNWSTTGKTNLIPDTNTWIMSNSRSPDVWGGYEFEATFTSAWEGFSCFFSEDLLERVKGKTVLFGVNHLTGASSRLELIVDGSVVNYILATTTPAEVEASIPETATSVTLRIIIFSEDDLHCEFTGLYMNDKAEEISNTDDGVEIYLVVRKVLQEKLPATGVSGTIYFTEKGNMYLVKDDGSLLPLAGSETL